jgi:hypothetical protein
VIFSGEISGFCGVSGMASLSRGYTSIAAAVPGTCRVQEMGAALSCKAGSHGGSQREKRGQEMTRRKTIKTAIRPLATVALAGSILAFPAVAPAQAASTVTVACSATAGADLAHAIDAASSGDTLVLADHCVYSLTKAAAGEDGLPRIEKKLTIEGHNATIRRDATASFRIVDVGASGNLTLKDVTVANGSVATMGGGILVQSGGVIVGNAVTIQSNTAAIGGGLHVALGGSANLTGGSISGNVSSMGPTVSVSAVGPATLSGTVVVGSLVQIGAVVHGAANVNAGIDAGVNAGINAGVNAGIDAGVNAGVDAGVNAGVDAGVNAGVDAGVNAGVDVGGIIGIGILAN